MLETLLNIAQLLVLISLLLGFVRLAKGPTLADRIVALDMMTISLISFCALVAIQTDNTAFLDVVVVLTLIGFVATVAMARFSERFLRKTRKEKRETP